MLSSRMFFRTELTEKAVVLWTEFIYYTTVWRQSAYLFSPVFVNNHLAKSINDTGKDNSKSNNVRVSGHCCYNLYP